MKISILATLLIITVCIFSYCSSSKKAASAPVASKPVYSGQIETLIMANCSPCHIPSRGGNKKPLNTYEAAKAEIDDIIKRIELNPTDRGFMPFRKAKLSDSTIQAFKQWKAEGFAE